LWRLSLLLIRSDRKHLDEGVSLPHDSETDNSQRRRQLEEALDHTRKIIRATDRITLRGDGLHSKQAQHDHDGGCLSYHGPVRRFNSLWMIVVVIGASRCERFHSSR